MSGGTKVFLAVFALLVGTLVLYYYSLGPDELADLEIEQRPLDPLADAGSADRADEHMIVRSGSDEPREPQSQERPRRLDEDAGRGESIVGEPDDVVAMGEPWPGTAIAGNTADPWRDEPVAQPAAPTTAAAPPAERSERPADPVPLPATALTRISQLQPERAVTPVPSHRTYVVESGDTLSSIADRWLGAPWRWREIAAANPGVDPHRLQPGNVLKVPLPGAAPAASVPQPQAPSVTPPRGDDVYVVRSGDTLSRIAGRQLGDPLRWREIYEANQAAIGSDPHALKVGMELQMPRR